ncbi:ABC transporter substrate-binding protein [Tessaracoccus sp. MC1627]|uniref:ABC transporter substrate-binding protein n=1 Tax=Tessaracoccus sp. MC1627 TaxID=2760312 RepID=UPI001C719DC4|nr:ABC transporter substrate-binding protein [Tessaracoccus sp. MC1627]
MRRARTLGIVMVLMLSTALGACTRPPVEEEEEARTLTIGATGEPAGLDMITVSGAGTPFVLLYNVYETLVKLDGEGTIRPLLASEWLTSEDNTVYTFTIDSGARFASGTDVTAEAVVESFERNRGAAATDQIKGKWAAVDTIEALDEDTVEVTLNQPSNQWLYEMTGPAGIVTDPTGAANLDTTPAGSGPFQFVAWEEGSSVELKANPSYWATPSRFGSVIFRYYADPNAMNTAMLAGQLDIISNLTVPQAIGQFDDEERFTVHEGTTDGEVVLGFNHRTPALQDLKVRQAINHAIDREALIDAAWGGKGTLIGSMVPPTDPWFEDLSDTYPFDQAKARELLAEAGYATGLTLRLRVPNLPYGPPAGRYIAAKLQEVGITVELDELEFPARWLDLVYTAHDYDMTIVAHVEPRDIGAFANPEYYWGYDNPEFQELVTEADAGTPEEQVAKLRQAARILADDAAASWLFLLPNLIITTPEISGIQANQISLAFDLTTIAARS